MRTYSSWAAVAASILALALAGCGGSSKKSTTSTTAASSGTSTPALTSTTSTSGKTTSTSGKTSTSSTAGSHPLTKAAYEAKLGPLLNGRVAPALKSALANGGATSPQKLATAAHLLDEARDAMASLTPPTQIADLNQQAVVALGTLGADMTKMRDELVAHNNTGYVNAAHQTVTDALKIEAIGNQFTKRGF
jgi:hypothetical protein